MAERKLKFRKAWVYSPVVHKLVELTFYTDGRRDNDARWVVWTVGDNKAYHMSRGKDCWFAGPLVYSYDSKHLVYEYTKK